MSTFIGMGATKENKTYTDEDVNELIGSKNSEIDKLKEELKITKSNDSKTAETKKIKELKEHIDALTKEKEDANVENKSLKEQVDALTKKIEELETDLQNNDSKKM